MDTISWMVDLSGAHGAARQILDAVTPVAAGTPGVPRLSDELVAALRDSGAWRMLQPARHGGRGADPDEYVSAVCALAALDGSVGWLTAMFNAAAYDVSLSDQAAETIWGRDPTSLVAAGYRPEGQLVRTGTGKDRRLSGRWRHVAGVEFADWLLLTADGDG